MDATGTLTGMLSCLSSIKVIGKKNPKQNNRYREEIAQAGTCSHAVKLQVDLLLRYTPMD